ncbi:enoyl-CoA hydratase [Ectobacillus sp. JY-23]|uniref:enoyl-CoA hydratase n=1 Tax=Ectobacillus sp. JY-23 TaxID=2933872 RepID=UPI001FF5812A|nr:enoyl-CoA hydratase [Ectobacillus sp. JY-23]UOY92046.1 enoyl-CoA hydratase [Ectobacillus sp. JY-23]
MTVSSSTECVIVKYEGRIATVMLNRPTVLNALDEATLKELLDKLKEVAKSAVDVVVLCGNGRGFSAGGDIKSMLASTDESKFLPIMDAISELIVTLYTMPKLVISAIHGPTAGLGLSLALAADYVIADTSSVIAMNFIGIALIPDGGGHFFLQNRVGTTVAKQIIWEGKRMTADEALKAGVVDEVVAQDFPKAVREKAEAWLQKPVKAMVQTKQILCEGNKQSLLQVLELEKEGQFRMRATADHKEGIAAFLEKRIPVFQGK